MALFNGTMKEPKQTKMEVKTLPCKDGWLVLKGHGPLRGAEGLGRSDPPDEDQFCGCVGLSSLSNSTMYRSESGSDGKGLDAPPR